MLKIKNKKGETIATLEDEDEAPQFIKDKKKKKDQDEETEDEREDKDEEV